ncbi:MAG: LEPR-XLL domain-containing protein [Planctomycetes bacterium]|nr:LEPR-XLL domain-containing protein [Planctomycetota bacterium]
MRTQPQLEMLEPRLLLDGAPPAAEAPRFVDFAGMQWQVRSAAPQVQGDNWYSDADESVWVDEAGLHLKVRRVEGTWYAAEVVSTQTTMMGVHQFYVVGRPDLLDANVVFETALVGGGAEMAVQFGPRLLPGDPRASFVVDTPEGVVREPFDIELNGTTSTCGIDWGTGEVAFNCFHWHGDEPLTPAHRIASWTHSSDDLPTAASEVVVRFGLSLQFALPPANLQEVEIVIAQADLPNHAPRIRSVATDAEWLLAGEPLTITAAGVSDFEGTVAHVAFYRDRNGDGIGDVEERLGVDTNGADGYTWTGPAAWPVGTTTLLVRATDVDGVSSGWAPATVTVAPAPEIVVTIGTSEDAQGRQIRYADPDGSIIVVGLTRGRAVLGFTRPPATVVTVPDGLMLAGGFRLVTLDLSDTTVRSVLAITVKGGLDGRAEVNRIAGATAVGAIKAPQVDLVGGGLRLTGDGAVGSAAVGDLRAGADIRMDGEVRGGLALTAGAAEPGSTIDILRGPVRAMAFTGEFAGLVTTGVRTGPDGLWFTADDVLAHDVRVGPVRVAKPTAAPGDRPQGFVFGPSGGTVVVPRRGMQNTGALPVRCVPSADAAITIVRATGRPDARLVAGRLAGVARRHYLVALYVRRTDGTLALVRSAYANSAGVWMIGRVPAGELHAYLVAREAVLPPLLADPMPSDGLLILGEAVLAETA